MNEASFDVRLWQIEERPRARGRYRVRWKVAGRLYRRSFTTKTLADAFRAQLMDAARKGERFSTRTGLPQSLSLHEREISCYEHARQFLAATWPTAAAKSRISFLETLSVALPVLTREIAGEPGPDVLRHALRHALNQNPHARPPDDAELRALVWLERASLPISALDDPSVVASCSMSSAASSTAPRPRRITTRGAAG